MSGREDARTAAFERIHARQRETGVSPIPLLIRRLTHSYGRRADAALREELGISVARFTILVTLEAEQGLTGAALAELTGQRPQSLADAVAALEREGLVERRAGRGRERLHFLTSEGARRLEPARERVRGVQEAALAGFSEAERAQLESMLARLLDALEAGADGQPGEPAP